MRSGILKTPISFDMRVFFHLFIMEVLSRLCLSKSTCNSTPQNLRNQSDIISDSMLADEK